MNKNIVLKSLFKVKRTHENEQAKMDRYYRYFDKLNKKVKSKESELMQELYSKCVGNPSIDVDVKDLVVSLHESICGGADE